jgi:hypothetical protein
MSTSEVIIVVVSMTVVIGGVIFAMSGGGMVSFRATGQLAPQDGRCPVPGAVGCIPSSRAGASMKAAENEQGH